MEVINKLYSSVTQTVFQLSSVLPGNAVTREYEATGHIASAGRACMWKIYSGFKKSTRQNVSIFVMEKKQFENYSKEEKEEIFNIVRNGIINLTKIRHPQVLTVQHPIEESRESFAFASEPVYASLANILGDTMNVPPFAAKELARYNLHEVEIKYGLLHLFQGIQFIHNNAKLVHRNINPYSVVLNSNGVWKIFGFDYSRENRETILYDLNPNQNILTFPCLEYTAPECILDKNYSSRADYYSLGILICAIYTKKCYPFKTVDRGVSAFHCFLKEMRVLEHAALLELPQEIRSFIKKLLIDNPAMRENVVQLSKSAYFDDICVKSLSYLDTIFQRNNQEKAKFFKGLFRIIEQLPPRVNLIMVLPCLFKAFVNPTMIPFVLPNVFLIARKCTQLEFDKFVFVHLKPIMSLQEPIQILLIFMQNMELLLKLTSSSDVKLHVLPMVYRALESNSKQIQELCLTIIPSFADLVDHTSMKNFVLTRIKNLCANTTFNSVRVNCLLCIGQLLPHLDKWTVLDDILLFLPTLTAREPAVIMAIIGIYKIVANHKSLGIPKEFCANKVLPFLWPLSIQNGLTLQQYSIIVAFMNDLTKKVEVEHMNKLQQLNTSDSSVQLDIMVPTAIKNTIDEPKHDVITKMFSDMTPMRNTERKCSDNLNSYEDNIGTNMISTSTGVRTPVQSTAPLSLRYSLETWSQLNGDNESASSIRQRNNTEPLKSTINNNSQNFSDTISLITPVNISKQNNTEKSDTILSKEDILEFLK